MAFIATTVTSLLLLSCTPISPPALEVSGIDSPKDQALEALATSPSSFLIENSELLVVDQRLNLFFESYLNKDLGLPNTTGGSAEVTLRAVGSTSYRLGVSDNYRYEVSKTPATGGIVYHIEVAPRGNKGSWEGADRNTRNLSRFLREGVLELSLFER